MPFFFLEWKDKNLSRVSMESVDCVRRTRGTKLARAALPAFIRTRESRKNPSTACRIYPSDHSPPYQTFASLSRHPYQESVLGRIVGIQDHIPRTETNRTRDGMRNNSKTEWIPELVSRLRDGLVLFENARGGQEGGDGEGGLVVGRTNVELVQGKNPNLARARKGEVGKAAGVRCSR